MVQLYDDVEHHIIKKSTEVKENFLLYESVDGNKIRKSQKNITACLV